MPALKNILQQLPAQPILPAHLLRQKYYTFQLCAPSDFAGIDPLNTPALMERTQALLTQHQAQWAIGKHGEKRDIYQHTQFTHTHRNIHLGLDITAPHDTPVYAPLDGRCHSFADNDQAGDFGPTIILEHRAQGLSFYTLYGHLSRQSLSDKQPGQYFKAGDLLGSIGSAEENGGWPPHLHVQIIDHIDDYSGNFPGVCNDAESAIWLTRCPDPNLLLKLF
jgi:peptidoglycan LD-endopeptidase LytH